VEGVSRPDLAGQGAVRLDLAELPLRQVNHLLHRELPQRTPPVPRVDILNPAGMHNVAVGLDADLDVHIHGHVGYYVAGMNKRARVTVHGNAGRGAAENIMSGAVRIEGSASDNAAASGRGGLVVIAGNAASRCAISLKGADVVVGGNVGHVSAFMAQRGRLVVCGDAGPGLGDSLYEAVIYVRGKIQGLGADAREEPFTLADREAVASLLAAAGFECDPGEFKRVASARTLYHWNVEHSSHYG
jgi:methylamine---glutamate N-methyltransferase subunit B